MMKKLLYVLSAICFSFAILLPTVGVNAQALASKGKSISIYVENCNIQVSTTNKKDIFVDYDKKFFQVTQETKGEQNTVSVSGNEASKKDPTNTVPATVYIPESMLDLPISIKSVYAGTSVSPINADLTLDATNSSVSFCVPDDFSKNIDVTLKDGAYSALVSKKSTNYSLNVQINNCAMSWPEEWGIGLETTYQKKEGNGKSQINVSAENSAFSLKMKDSLKK